MSLSFCEIQGLWLHDLKDGIDVDTFFARTIPHYEFPFVGRSLPPLLVFLEFFLARHLFCFLYLGHRF